MSTKPKRKAKPRTTRKERSKPARKRKVPEEKKGPISAPEKIVEAIKEKPFFLAVRLQGPFGVPPNFKRTLSSLRLNKRFSAALLEKNDSSLGMLRLAKDYITWGEVGPETIAPLLRERAELLGGVHLTDKYVREKFGQESVEELAQALTKGRISLKVLWHNGVKPVFRLRPPSGGFEASVKRPFRGRGELGYRGERISDLLSRMM